jgi:hypothetical protein
MVKREDVALIFLVIIALLLLIISNAHAEPKKKDIRFLYTVEFVNQSNETVLYVLYWLDHPYTSYPDESVEAAGGELLPGESATENIIEGVYYIGWTNIDPDGLNTLLHGEHFRHFADTTFIYK